MTFEPLSPKMLSWPKSDHSLPVPPMWLLLNLVLNLNLNLSLNLAVNLLLDLNLNLNLHLDLNLILDLDLYLNLDLNLDLDLLRGFRGLCIRKCYPGQHFRASVCDS